MRTLVNKRINTRWFVRTLKDRGMTGRGYARKIESQSATVSRMFRGLRRFGLEDAEQFSKITGASIEEVLANAGLSMDDVTREHAIKVAGWIDKDRRIHPKVKGPRTVSAPAGLVGDALAYRYQTAKTELEALDGAVIYCRPLGELSIDMLNRWCVVRLRDGDEMLRIIKRGSRAGRFNLFVDGTEMEKDHVIEAAAIVEWARF